MILNVTGPNIGMGGEWHVHRAGCADLRRRPYRGNPESLDEEYASLRQLVETTWSDIIADNEGDPHYGKWENYLDTFKVFPCVKGLPDEEPKVETIPIDQCICEGEVNKPRTNCWATQHNLKGES
ncbi:MAG: hypothetical protein K0Q89_34 [Thermomicrobiales bacterium]|jgi:hypothetical protein|nr:hypothetical protein [Thermomicrobiales bacterium]